MRKKIIVSIAVIIITIFLVISVFNNQLFFEKKEKLSDEKITNIQDIIDGASDKDVIHLSNEIYYGKLSIDKQLTIKGNTKEDTIIDGGGLESIITINCDNVIIENITVRNSGGHSGDSAIKIISNNNQIKNCVIYKSRTGIKIDESKNNIISNCFFHTNGEGILCNYSHENIIKHCQFRNNAFGIHLNNCDSEEIKNSYLHTNGLGIYDKKSTNTKIYDSAICDNNQDGGGVWSYQSKKLEIKNSNINHNGAGIRLEESDADISNCNLNDNMYNTFRILNVGRCNIQDCDIKDSYRTAIYLRTSMCNINNNNIYNSALYGLDCGKDSLCNAKNNYWGSKIGPSITSFGLGDKITFRILNNNYFPWELKPIGNIGSDWNVEEKFNKKNIMVDKTCKIKFQDLDSDGDNAPDYWEEKWGYNPNRYDEHLCLDPDNDGLNNIEECYTEKYGSNPFYKDIFIEVDYSKGNKPTDEYIQKTKDIFKKHEIALHIDTGGLDGGEKLPFNSINSCSEFRDIYWNYFLHNNLDNPRKGIFRYAVIVDSIDELYGAFVFVGCDNLDSIGFATKVSKQNYWHIDGDKIIVGGIIHELGHTMGLLIDDHGGIDNVNSIKFFTKDGWQYKNYFSCLNYRYVFLLLGFSDGSHGRGDFDDWSNLDYSFFKNTNFEIPNID